MFIVENYSTAVFFCIITMLCWGSWANTQKLASRSWRFELFYWDYVIGIFLFSLLFGLTAGSMGSEGRSFFTDLRQADGQALISAFTGGIVFNAANILLGAAISIAGMAVAFPIGIGIALVLGVVVNYFSGRQGNPVFLFAGVACITVAILLNAAAYRKKGTVVGASGTIKSGGAKGILLSLVAGVLMSFFYRFVAGAMDLDDFKHPAIGKMTPYSAVFIFSVGILVSNFLFNTILMRRPLEGAPVNYGAYFAGKPRTHLVGVLGGLIWGLGNGLNLLASGLAGPAVSYGLGQGATLVAAAWGVFIWREFSPAGRTTRQLIAAMFVFFIAGIGMIIFAGRAAARETEPVAGVIFDSDMGPDYDDVGAITLLHGFADSGKIHILATMASTRYEGVAAVLNVFNTYFRRPEIPVGVPTGAAVDQRDWQHWTDSILARYPHALRQNSEATDAVSLYRKILSGQPDQSVVIVTVGFLTNISGLLQSGPDHWSDLSGEELVRKKVKQLVSMAGSFPSGKEFNVFKDAGASRFVFSHWPGPVLFSGFEIGKKIKCGLPLIADTSIRNSPVKDVFRIAIPMAAEDSAGRMSWDESAVLVAIAGPQPYYSLHKGHIEIAEDGSNTWVDGSGEQAYLVEERPAQEVQDLINGLIKHQPR